MRLAAALCLAGAIALQITRDSVFPRVLPSTEAILYVRSTALARRVWLGFDAVAADVYWVRALQHFGRQRLSAPGGDRDFSLLYPLLDLTTSLDPYFSIAYRFGAIFLSLPYPEGPGRPDLAVALLEKGISVQPDRWQYYHDIGFVQYWSLGDARAAADWFQRAAQQPDAPPWLTPVAAAMLTAGAERDSARHLWRQMLTSPEDWLRNRAQLALAQLDALDQIESLETVVKREPPPAGQPYAWTTLIRRGRLPGVPVDPAGTPYVLDPASGRVRVSEASRLFPMPRTAPAR